MFQTLSNPSKLLLSWLPNLRKEIWILAAGRLLLGIGQGFTLVYASIFFVNQVGLSATQVGFALGSAAISGVVGRFLSGSLADSEFCGRKGTLLLSALVSAVASFCLAITYNFPTLVIGNLLLGLGVGLYWPATEAFVADLTASSQRNEAFSLTRLADTIGMGLGVILAGKFIAVAGSYRTLFIIKSISFLVFLGIIYFALAESAPLATAEPIQSKEKSHNPKRSWLEALSDRILIIWLGANILFTTYDAYTNTILPLYFANFLFLKGGETGFTPETISLLFFLHTSTSAVFQLPIARFLNRFVRLNALKFTLILWGLGFVLIWLTGIVSNFAIITAALALFIFAFAKMIYIPSSSSFVSDLAPESLRGVYFSLESQTWAMGYFLAPSLGGWALDRSPEFAKGFWLVTACSVGLGLLILSYLSHKVEEKVIGNG